MEEYIEKVDAGLREYVERTILPRYHSFDAAHRIDHVATVIAESLNLAAGHPEVDINMAYAIAAYHDTGLVAGRDRHHEASGETPHVHLRPRTPEIHRRHRLTTQNTGFNR